MPNPETYSILAGKASRLWVFEGLACSDEGGWEGWLVDGEERLSVSANAHGKIVGQGRNPVWRVDVGGFRGVWKTHWHGGLLGGILRARYWGVDRLESEVHLAAALRAAGVATPRVLLALAARSGLFWKHHIVTEEISNSATVFELRNRREVLEAAHHLMRKVFNLGLWAPDLHPGNLLWVEETKQCYLLDLAGARLLNRPLTDLECAARLDRFNRFMHKYSQRHPRS